MTRIDVLIIGAGQAGLAMSRCLSDLGIEHLVLDRGPVAGRWRSERWASLRLLTPNWMTRLPGFAYSGPDPDGFMRKDELVRFLNRYARDFDAPVLEYTPVFSLAMEGARFAVETGRGRFSAGAVVIATGACDRPRLPDWAARLPSRITRVTTQDYVHPDQLSSGGVLVVGGSATGVQLAEEIHRTGRPVTLACGSHVWLPRRYRGRDIMAWMDRAGLLSEARDPTLSPRRALGQPSLQLVGAMPPRDVGLTRLNEIDVHCVGRANGAEGGRLTLSGTLQEEMARAGRRCQRVLSAIDAHIAARGGAAGPTERPDIPALSGADPTELDLDRAGIRTVVWATGFRRDYSWVDLPVLDGTGELVQFGGVTNHPGLFAMGLPFMRRRNSTFIDGVGADARDLSTLIGRHLGQHAPLAA